MKYNIILIGPMCVGKTLYANIISEKSHFGNLDIDIEKHNYIATSSDFKYQHAKELGCKFGWKAGYDYAESFFKIKHLKIILSDITNELIQIGANQIDFKNEQTNDEIEAIFEEFPNIFLLRPNQDNEESLKILTERVKSRDSPSERDLLDLINFNREILSNALIARIAKHTIFTDGKTKEEIIEEINAIYNASLPPINPIINPS